MDKKTFNKITKEIFTEYGFTKKGSTRFILVLQDISITVRFASWRGVKYFGYTFGLHALYDDSTPFEQRFDSIVETKIILFPTADGYHSHEVLYEQYTETEYRTLLTNALHSHFDAFKENALKFIRNNHFLFCIRKEANEYLGIVE